MLSDTLQKKSTAIIAISKKQKQELTEIHKIANKDKVEVVNLGFELDRFQQNMLSKKEQFNLEHNIDEDAICIGIIGRLTMVKNHQMFFDVIEKVLEKTINKIHVFVIGDGELKESLEERAEDILRTHNDQKITFTSWIKDVSIPLARFRYSLLNLF